MKFIFLDTVICVHSHHQENPRNVTPHHPCLCASSLRCLSCLGEYGLNLVRVLSFPSCLPKSRDEIFLRGESCHSPRKKKKENKNPTLGPPVCLPFPLLLSVLPRRAPHASPQPANAATCRPSSTAMTRTSSTRPYPPTTTPRPHPSPSPRKP